MADTALRRCHNFAHAEYGGQPHFHRDQDGMFVNTPDDDLEPDMVNHPPHYGHHPSGVECIEVVEWYNFCVGNAIKYLWRHDKKGAPVEDLKKARWYIDREIDRLERVTGAPSTDVPRTGADT